MIIYLLIVSWPTLCDAEMSMPLDRAILANLHAVYLVTSRLSSKDISGSITILLPASFTCSNKHNTWSLLRRTFLFCSIRLEHLKIIFFFVTASKCFRINSLRCYIPVSFKNSTISVMLSPIYFHSAYKSCLIALSFEVSAKTLSYIGTWAVPLFP